MLAVAQRSAACSASNKHKRESPSAVCQKDAIAFRNEYPECFAQERLQSSERCRYNQRAYAFRMNLYSFHAVVSFIQNILKKKREYSRGTSLRICRSLTDGLGPRMIEQP